jgi:hypothetical protein
MKTTIENWQLPVLTAKIVSTLKSGKPINSLTRLKLTKLRSLLRQPCSDYIEQLPTLLDKHVKTDKNGHYLAESTPEGDMYVFKSEEDETQYMAVAQAGNTVDIPMPLSADDLGEIDTNAIEFSILIKFSTENSAENEPDTPQNQTDDE